VLFLVFMGRILEKGPDFASPVPPMRSGTTAPPPDGRP
jgi:hypothetical protein